MATLHTERALLQVLATTADDLYTRQIVERSELSAGTMSAALRDFIRLEFVTRRMSGEYRFHALTDRGRAYWERLQSKNPAGAGDVAS